MASRMVVPGVMSPLSALPGDGPAAALVADVVRVLAGDVDVRARLGQRQQALVLEQHQRLADRLPGHLTVGW